SDLICLLAATHYGNPPSGFTASLNESSMATLTWNGPGGQDHYLVVYWRASDPQHQTQVQLPSNQTTFQIPTNGVATCFAMGPFSGSQPLGATDELCAVPGISSFSTGGTAQG